MHDWLTAPSSIAIKHSIKKPLVFTAHSTENGRSGLHIPDSFTIDGIEWWATYEANKIIVTSGSMKGEVCGHFHISEKKVEIIPNAIDWGRTYQMADALLQQMKAAISPASSYRA
jgi:glycosyltransferase involved in cell wall biosynthesis